MKGCIRTLLFCSIAFAAGAIRAGDDYPSKPIKIIVPFSVGGSADIGARRLGQLVGERLGQSVIVENRPGAGGNIGTAVAAKSQPDGYTLVYMLNTTMGVNPHAYQNTGYDPLKDFTPIIVSVKYQGILVVRADSAIRSVADLVRSAKSQPGKLSYASSGGGSPAHLMAERLNHLAGMEVLHVPYKSEAQYLPELIGGQLDFAFGFAAATLPHITSGKLRALGVSATTRLPTLPDVQTLGEAGIAGYDESGWAGYAVPAGTAPERVGKLHHAFQDALRSPEFATFLDSLGYELVAGTQAEAAALIKTDYERYAKIVKVLGLRIE